MVKGTKRPRRRASIVVDQDVWLRARLKQRSATIQSRHVGTHRLKIDSESTSYLGDCMLQGGGVASVDNEMDTFGR